MGKLGIKLAALSNPSIEFCSAIPYSYTLKLPQACTFTHTHTHAINVGRAALRAGLGLTSSAAAKLKSIDYNMLTACVADDNGILPSPTAGLLKV